MKEAKKLLQLSEMKGLPYEPAEISKDGFVFSNAEIHAAIDKDRRLNRANQTDFSRHKPQKLHAKRRLTDCYSCSFVFIRGPKRVVADHLSIGLMLILGRGLLSSNHADREPGSDRKLSVFGAGPQ